MSADFLEMIELEKVAIPEGWSDDQFEKFRNILELLLNIDEEHLPQVWCVFTDLVSARLSCSPGTLIEALGGIVENVVNEAGPFHPERHPEDDYEG